MRVLPEHQVERIVDNEHAGKSDENRDVKLPRDTRSPKYADACVGHQDGNRQVVFEECAQRQRRTHEKQYHARSLDRHYGDRDVDEHVGKVVSRGQHTNDAE